MNKIGKRILWAGALAAMGLINDVSAAYACARQGVSGANVAITGNAINQKLIDAAILSEVNYSRCKSGLNPLKSASGLRSVASNHAKWMARAGKISHKSGVAGQSTLRARMSSSGVNFSAGSENIGMVHRFQIDGSSFRIRDAGSCSFATNSGKAIPPHSYATLARSIVGYWMSSPGHRANILNRKVSLLGSGAAVRANAPYCGQIFISQNFAG
jgi:uncharacterized protein YkwD